MLKRSRTLLAGAFATCLVTAGPSTACGFHPQLNGGFSIGYPGALDIAVAVADARRSRLLQDGFRPQLGDAARFRRTMRDLQHLYTRLAGVEPTLKSESGVEFSLILVGPDLWSNFMVRRDATFARYHETGPSGNGVVVLTHHTVLRALLSASLPIDTAIDRKLVVFSGEGTPTVRRLFDAAFRVNNDVVAKTE